MFTEYCDVVTVRDLAKMLDIGTVLAYRLIHNKTIASRKIGREHKILKKDVITYLSSTSSTEV